MTIRSCDVLIVGGGPAGSACARQLVRAGRDVLVMDKQPFPRDKVCAGWITPAVIDALELDCDDYTRSRVMQPIHGFRTGLIGEAPVETFYDQAASFGILRREFDDYLLRRSGARLRLGETMRTMERYGSGWLVNGDIRTPMVVGAGGIFVPSRARLIPATATINLRRPSSPLRKSSSRCRRTNATSTASTATWCNFTSLRISRVTAGAFPRAIT